VIRLAGQGRDTAASAPTCCWRSTTSRMRFRGGRPQHPVTRLASRPGKRRWVRA
jgi:hypothetical protein